MSVGINIREARELCGLTQKELGLKCGFSESTADVRIRQYESNKMIPKQDKLEAIADALGVSTETLTTVRVMSDTLLLHTLFRLEETWGLKIHKDPTDDSFYLKFDENFYTTSGITRSLETWYNKSILVPQDENDPAYKSKEREYQLWKNQYPLAEEKFMEDGFQAIEQKYTPLIQSLYPNYCIRTVSEFIQVIERMIRCGISVEVDGNIDWGYDIVLDYSEIINAHDDIEKTITEFYAMIAYLLSKECYYNPYLTEYKGKYRLSYGFEHHTIEDALHLVVEPFINDYQNSDFDDLRQIEYEDDLRQFNVPIFK